MYVEVVQTWWDTTNLGYLGNLLCVIIRNHKGTNQNIVETKNLFEYIELQLDFCPYDVDVPEWLSGMTRNHVGSPAQVRILPSTSALFDIRAFLGSPVF